MGTTRISKLKAGTIVSLYYQIKPKARIINAAKAMYLMPPGFGDPVIFVWP
ncbi:MAG: hypothetical protein IKJ45_15285 [Kiritimatiellae bacterium]|nr:hypothetical protein [Kiritimatiellia bacterium]